MHDDTERNEPLVHPAAAIACAVGVLAALWLGSAFIGLVAGAYSALTVREACVRAVESLRPATKAERRMANAVERAVRQRMSAGMASDDEKAA